ncbi:uncharacterized protein [Physcomitrium patens]|uniref:uncharacterized protein isoform X2 n=1 Tax=Physcomitrium patens TaxID=3218 RepID=UPI003CCCBC90
MARPKRRRAASPPPEEAAAVAAPSKSRSNRKEALMKSVVQQPSKKSKRNQKDGLKQGEGEPSGSVAELKSNPHKLAAPLVVFAHGAGANSSHEWMVRWKKLLAEATNAVEVVTFDYPYCANGKKGAPPKAEKLVESHREEISRAVSQHPGHPLVLVGKSMGSRVSCIIAGTEGTDVAAVGANGALRDQTLLELQTPVLFVQGSKDSMCPLTELEKVLKNLSVMNEVHVVEGGDHSLKKGKRAGGLSQEEEDQKALEHINAFITKALTNTK